MALSGLRLIMALQIPIVIKLSLIPKYGTAVDSLVGLGIQVSFVCVPTPMGNDASIDASILIDTISKLLLHTEGLVVVKSTVIPSIIQELAKSDRVIYNPEFLTENQQMKIL